MVSACAGLVVVDEQSGIIRLVNYTIQEYFERVRPQNLWSIDVEADIAISCITYLSFDVFELGFCYSDQGFEERLRYYPFYSYAAINWGYHVFHADRSRALANTITIDFLQQSSKVQAADQTMTISRNLDRCSNHSQWPPKGVTGTHAAAYFGCKYFGARNLILLLMVGQL